MNSSNGNNALRSPRIQRRANRSPTIGSQQQQQQEVVINPTGQHRYQSSAMAGGPTVISPKAVHLSSPTMSRKILPNDFSVSPLSSVSTISLSHARTASEHQPNLSVWVPLRTAGGSSSSSSSANNNYYHQQPQQTTTNAAIRSLPSPLLPHQREGQRNNNVQRNLDVDRESVDTGIATQLCHPPFHVEQRAVYVGRLLPSAAASAVDAHAPLYQMEPVIKSRKVIGALDVTQLINDARCCGSSMTLLASPQTTAYNYLY